MNQFSDKELDLINKSFSPNEYISIVFNHVFNHKILINQSDFKEFLYQKSSNDFIQHYRQQLMTLYAIEYPNNLKNEELYRLFSDTYQLDHIHLVQFSDFSPNEPVLNKNFWTYFKGNTSFIKSYIQKCIQNHWSDALSLMCEQFSLDCSQFIQKDNKNLTEDDIFLEKIYYYKQPKFILSSNLTENDLNFVLSKLYDDIPNKDLTHPENEQYYNSLYQGIYYLFNYIAQKDSTALSQLFEKFPNILPGLITDFSSVSYSSLKPLFQQEFIDNVFSPNLDLIFRTPENIKSVLYQGDSLKQHKEPNLLLTFLGKHSHLLSKTDQQHCIFRLLKNHFYVTSTIQPLKLIDSLNLYSIESLNHFKENIDLFILIVNDSNKISHYSEQIKELLDNVILNKKLNHKLLYNSPNNIKKLKI